MATLNGAIDRTSAVPLYHQLEDLIRRDIEQGGYEVGAMLPSESEICARYDVSRSVVRQALQHLVQEGIVRTERGRGSFVAEAKLSERFVQRTTGFYDDLTRMGLRVDTRVLRQEIATVPRRAREFLGVSEAVRLDRLRSVEGRVLAYVRTFLAAERCPGLERFDLADQSLYAHLREVYGLEVHDGMRTVEAVPADNEIAPYLEVEPGTPLLLLCSASRTADGQPLEWFAAWHRADRTRFEVEITSGDQLRPFEQTVIHVDGLGDRRSLAAGTVPGTTSAESAEAAAVSPAAPSPALSALTERLARERVIAVARAPHYADGGLIAGALLDGGVGVVAFSVQGANAYEAITQARTGSPGTLVGARSVVSLEQARRAVDAGAQFLVSPVRWGDLLTEELGVPVILSGATHTEVFEASRLTGGPVELQPPHGGRARPDHLRSVTTALGGLPLIAAGQIDVGAAAELLAAGALAVNLGPELCPVAALTDGNRAELAARATTARDALAEAGP